MGLAVDKIRKTKLVAQQPVLLETPIGEEETSHLGDFIEDKAVMSPSDAAIGLDLKEQTALLLKTNAARRSGHQDAFWGWLMAPNTLSRRWTIHSQSHVNASVRSKRKRYVSCGIRPARAISASSPNDQAVLAPDEPIFRPSDCDALQQR